jgi:hypothetical protein
VGESQEEFSRKYFINNAKFMDQLISNPKQILKNSDIALKTLRKSQVEYEEEDDEKDRLVSNRSKFKTPKRKASIERMDKGGKKFDID